MQTTRWLLAVGLITCVVAGCERREPAPPPAAAQSPTTAPAPNGTIPPVDQTAAEHAADSGPSPAYLAIDQQPVEFPPAKLRLATRNGGVSALLMSDDPPQAINDDYLGNSFYLEMELPVPQPADVTGSIARYQAPTGERIDSRNGIFLEGGRLQLQPFDVEIAFDGSAPVMTVTISGTFLRFDSRDTRSPPQLVSVRGEMFATVIR